MGGGGRAVRSGVALARLAETRLVGDGSGSSSRSLYIDALQPIYDQLKINPLWWILEIIPLTYSYQDAQGKWHKNLR